VVVGPVGGNRVEEGGAGLGRGGMYLGEKTDFALEEALAPSNIF
jgi:hypothetical protein